MARPIARKACHFHSGPAKAANDRIPFEAAVVGGDTLTVRKPDPAPLFEAVARAGRGRAVLAGDSIADADTARASGVPFVAASFGFSDRPVEALGADAVIDHYGELIGALGRLAAGPDFM